MLEKHKKLIENYALDKNEENNSNVDIDRNDSYYSFDVFNNELKINLDEKIIIKNIDNNDINIWQINNKDMQISIIINKINTLDVVAMIAIVDCNKASLTIKQTPTNMYISYNDNAIGYDINKISADLIVNIIEDYLNKKRLLSNVYTMEILRFIRIDIDEIFATIEKNKEKYIDSLNHQLNNLNAKYIMESEKLKKKIKIIKNYQTV